MSNQSSTAVRSPAEAADGAGGISPGLLLTVALLSAIGPFAADLYLPAFPAMVRDLHASATVVQLTLTAYLFGQALGQLAFGPLSDRYGRLKPLIIGATGCVLASAVTVAAPTVSVLIGARFAQGFAMSAGMVIGRAIISDLATGKEAARAFSFMMIVIGVAPVIAPVAGGVLAGPIGWRGALAIVLALSAAVLVAVLAVVPDTHNEHRRAQLRDRNAGAGSPLRDLLGRRYLGNTAVFCFAFAALMAYISASPFVYQSMMGLSASQFGAMFGLNALGLVSVSAVTVRLTRHYHVHRLAAVGIAVLVITAVAILIVAASGVRPGWLAPLLFVAVSANGLVFGNATVLALDAARRAAGSASAGLGAAQFLLAAAVSPLVGVAGESSALPLGVVMVTATILAAAGYLVAGNRPAHR